MSTKAAPSKLAAVVFPDLRASFRTSQEDQGFTQGHAAGYSAGLRAAGLEQQRLREQLAAEQRAMLDDGRAAVRQAVLALEAAAADFRQRRGAVLAEADDVLAAGAIELAEAILGYELADGRNTARGALARALGATSGVDDATTVRLHPADVAALAAVDVEEAAGVHIVADPALSPGDAIAEYEDGWLDARLATAVERAKQALLGNWA